MFILLYLCMFSTFGLILTYLIAREKKRVMLFFSMLVIVPLFMMAMIEYMTVEKFIGIAIVLVIAGIFIGALMFLIGLIAWLVHYPDAHVPMIFCMVLWLIGFSAYASLSIMEVQMKHIPYEHPEKMTIREALQFE